ncbi:hypothetical protein CPB86DRAFT_819135 [Serendipita vermifera]|nr:hypothetical protein CPB86DRAFT_819135 [Serendipita vermifera]
MGDIRSQAANPEVVKGFFEVRKRLMEQYNITAERDFAADESGVQQALQTQKRLLTRKGAKVYMVIFAAKNKRVEWINDIPPESEVTISENGWMTCDLGLEFIQIFDKSTEELAQDGGLDVVLFAPFKKAWTAAVHAYSMQTGSALTKSSFILVLDTAVKKSFTKENIQMAFKKTGVRPFNPDIITPQMLAPSEVTSEFRNQRAQAMATIIMPPPPNPLSSAWPMALPVPSLTAPIRHTLDDEGTKVVTGPYHPRYFNDILSSAIPPSLDEWNATREYIMDLESKHDVLLAVTIVQDVHYGQMKSQLYHKNQQQRKKSNKEKLYYTEEGREYTGDAFYQAALLVLVAMYIVPAYLIYLSSFAVPPPSSALQVMSPEF